MTITEPELWKVLKQKFCVQLKNDFSNKDIKAWLNHFAKNKKIDIHQHPKGNTIKIFTGNVIGALFAGRIPAKLMAKLYFKKLASQHYSHSEIELLGIRKSKTDHNKADVHIEFKRFNTSGKMYESAQGLYTLTHIKNQWSITEMSIYEDERLISKTDLKDMWQPA